MKKGYNFFGAMAGVFLLLGVLFIPFTFHFFPFQQQITNSVFGPFIEWTGGFFFGLTIKNTVVFSDSASMYILLLLILLLSGIISVLLIYIPSDAVRNKLRLYIYPVCVFYLSLVLMKYGLDKIFKTQFYLPEPNTLYTPLGQMDKDILFWSSMGTSRLYNLITGGIEILVAIFLFFRKTRLAGILLSMGAMLQIIILNFSFDISVKLFSSFLLFISSYLSWPFLKRIGTAIFTNKNELASSIYPGVTLKNIVQKTFLKCLLAGILLLESFYPYFRSKNFNDDKAARSYLHGAYSVQSVVRNNDTLLSEHFPFKQFFIHRNGYLIFKEPDGKMSDYHLTYDTANQLLLLEDYHKNSLAINYQYSKIDSLLVLDYLSGEKRVVVTGKMLDWKNLPLMNDSFHWFAE